MQSFNEEFNYPLICEEDEIDNEEYAVVYNIVNGNIVFEIPSVKDLTENVKNYSAKKYLHYLWNEFFESIENSYLSAQIIITEESSLLSISSENLNLGDIETAISSEMASEFFGKTYSYFQLLDGAAKISQENDFIERYDEFEVIDIEIPSEIKVEVPDDFFYTCLLRAISGLQTRKRYIGIAKIQNLSLPAWYIDIASDTYYPM